MLSGPFMDQRWMGSSESFDEAEWVMVGLPYDGTCSYRPGSRFAPQAIREASWGLETYSPKADKHLEDAKFFDHGDLELPFGNREKSLDVMEQAARETLAAGKKWLGVGGEHLVTYPVIKAYVEKYPDLAILHFDAHADLREEYLGETLSHATVLRRVMDLCNPKHFVQIGIRSGTEEEFAYMSKHNTLVKTEADLPAAKEKLNNRPVFITIDLDVLDPSIFPGTGTPEPGGLSYNELMEWLELFGHLNIVGADVVELSPHCDHSGVSSIVAAKVIRELILIHS